MTRRWATETAGDETVRVAVLGSTGAEGGDRCEPYGKYGEYVVLLGQAAPGRRIEPGQRLGAALASVAQAPPVACWGRQVHGARVLEVQGPGQDGPVEPGSTRCVGECDGLVTARPGIGLVVWTADCVPVLLAGGGAVAAVHSGWRGTAAGIVPGAIERLGRVHGVPPSRLAVVIGPAVGACHYEVGEEVVEALAGRGIPEPMWLDRGYAGGPRVDLRALLRAELEAAGVPRDRIELAGGCTFCDPALASYRRDGADAGRQWSMIWRRGSRGAA